ncbi:MAG: 2-phospho-L-lactate/phosphoenolpyruvate guanylyltransferase [Chloroflexota bacterium]|nr:2-phospho-L-lactate/phosphoenolpyruvate guanylyltransferase [Chloroflexota bacterium]
MATMTEERPSADLSRLTVIVPVGALEGAKSRLGDRLDAEERQQLVVELLDRTVRAAGGARAVASVVVVSPDPAALRVASAAGANPIRQVGDGLNEGLRTAARWALADGATAVLVLAVDLPGVSVEAIEALVAGAAEALQPGRSLVALVADRHERGTNALLVSPPDAIGFAFGSGSREAHLAEARAVGAITVELDGPLSLDLDLPDDLILAEELGLLDRAHAH